MLIDVTAMNFFLQTPDTILFWSLIELYPRSYACSVHALVTHTKSYTK